MRDEPCYTFGSVDNTFRPQREYLFGERERVTSRHAVECVRGDDLLTSVILGATGGASGVHDHSFVVGVDHVFAAVGPFVVSMRIPTLELEWSCQTDDATCFGVHFAPDGNSLISHGELEIARLTLAGEIVWQVSGADIFSGSLVVADRAVQVEDFEGRRYEFDLATGDEH